MVQIKSFSYDIQMPHFYELFYNLFLISAIMIRYASPHDAGSLGSFAETLHPPFPSTARTALPHWHRSHGWHHSLPHRWLVICILLIIYHTFLSLLTVSLYMYLSASNVSPRIDAYGKRCLIKDNLHWQLILADRTPTTVV